MFQQFVYKMFSLQFFMAKEMFSRIGLAYDPLLYDAAPNTPRLDVYQSVYMAFHSENMYIHLHRYPLSNLTMIYYVFAYEIDPQNLPIPSSTHIVHCSTFLCLSMKLLFAFYVIAGNT